MSGIEEQVFILHPDHCPGTYPAVLSAAAGGFHNGIVIFGICDKILCRSQVNGMVIAVAALFQVIDIIGAVLIIRHGVAHIGLLDAVLGGTIEIHIFVGFLLAAGSTQGGKVLVVRYLREGFALFLRCGGSCRPGAVVSAAGKEQAQCAQCGGHGNNLFFHGNLLIEGQGG